MVTTVSRFGLVYLDIFRSTVAAGAVSEWFLHFISGLAGDSRRRQQATSDDNPPRRRRHGVLVCISAKQLSAFSTDQRLLDVEHAGRDDRLENALELVVSVSVGLKSYLDGFGWLTDKLETKHISAKLRLSDFEVPTEGSVMAFNVHASTIRRFELPLDQEISVVAILVLSKQDLEIFIARTRDGNVRERELCHSAPTSDSTAGIGKERLTWSRKALTLQSSDSCSSEIAPN